MLQRRLLIRKTSVIRYGNENERDNKQGINGIPRIHLKSIVTQCILHCAFGCHSNCLSYIKDYVSLQNISLEVWFEFISIKLQIINLNTSPYQYTITHFQSLALIFNVVQAENISYRYLQ